MPADTCSDDKKRTEPPAETADDEVIPARFSPEEEKELVQESNTAKTEANTLFTANKLDAALDKYNQAIAVCPNYLDYEVAVLKSNVAACYLKLKGWKEATTAATDSLDRLDKVEKADAEEAELEKAAEAAELADVEDTIVSAGAEQAGPALQTEPNTPAQSARRQRAEDVRRIRAKALMRRARARSEAGGWSNLAGAEEDYKLLSKMPNLGPADRKVVQSQLRLLPPQVKAAQEKETAEMWGKLKELGNGILKPFGLSTDNFKMEQDPKTGGYSMNFQQNGSK